MERTVWLASYPKSGNTWFRIFLANLLYPEMSPVDFNQLPLQTPNAASRIHFDDTLGIPSALLTGAEIESLQPAANEELRRIWPESLLLRKTHDAYTWLKDGRPLLGRAPKFAAVYILRDPWDVAVSMSHHFNCSIEASIADLTNPLFCIATNSGRLSNQIPQRVLSWEAHARTWLGAPLQLHLMRYEEMHRNPLQAFRGAVRFLGLDHDDRSIGIALDSCRFERLQGQEKLQRFREASSTASNFFRSGKLGAGREVVSTSGLRVLEMMKSCVEKAITDRTEVI